MGVHLFSKNLTIFILQLFLKFLFITAILLTYVKWYPVFFQTTCINTVHGVPSQSIHTAAAAAATAPVISHRGSFESSWKYFGRCKKLALFHYFRFIITKPCTLSVIHVAAFMYGNNVPVEKAVDRFVACVGMYSYYVSCAVKDLYTTWDNLPSKTHLAP